MGKCINCGLCVKVCNRKAVTLEPSGPKLDLERCVSCGHCVAVCPTDAIDNPLSPRQALAGEPPEYGEAVRFLRYARSIRFFKDEEIPREKLLKLMDIGRYPQTGANSQGVSYILACGRPKVRELLEVFCRVADESCPGRPELDWVHQEARMCREGRDGVLRDCTCLIFALSDRNDQRGRENAQFSLTFVAELAPSLGLGTCWAGIFERLACVPELNAPIREAVGVPEDKEIRAVMMLGVPDIKFRRLVERRPLDISFI